MAYSIPCISINPDYMSVYDKWYDIPSKQGKHVNSRDNLCCNKRKTDISPSAKKRLNRAVSWLAQLSSQKKVFSKKHNSTFSFKCSFITLTLPSLQVHDDNIIKKELLNCFLTYARTTWGVSNYVWRAEKQANGNIHFHIMTDTFIVYWAIRKAWNRICEKLGYVSAFAARYPGRTPNSTDVHSVRNIKDIRKYIGKYMTKENDRVTVAGNTWGLSTSLSQLKNVVTDCVDVIADEFERLCNGNAEKLKKDQYFSALMLRFDDWKNQNVPYLRQLFEKFLLSVKKSICPELPVFVVD
jgi:hypothetical protein